MNWLHELIGITGTAFILVAFLCNSQKRIRQFDLVGAALFVLYGFLTKTWSTAVLNLALICIQVYKLKRLKVKGDDTIG